MRSVLLTAVLLLAPSTPYVGAFQLGLARVFVPPAVVLEVSNISATMTASIPVTVSFDSAVLLLGQALRISVKADGDLTIPGGAPIPATSLSWTTANSVNGVGISGALSKTAFIPVYESRAGATTGRVDLTWKLAATGGTIDRSGSRQAALRWRFEAVNP